MRTIKSGEMISNSLNGENLTTDTSFFNSLSYTPLNSVFKPLEGFVYGNEEESNQEEGSSS